MCIKMLRPVDRGVISSRCDAATFHFSSPARGRRGAHCSSNCLGSLVEKKKKEKKKMKKERERKGHARFPRLYHNFRDSFFLELENTRDLAE